MRISYGIADVCSSDLDRQIRGELWCVQPQSGTGAVRRRQVSRPRRAVDEYVHRDAVRALRMVGACAPGHMSGIQNRGGQGHMREPGERIDVSKGSVCEAKEADRKSTRLNSSH